jgi:hypothetical protein
MQLSPGLRAGAEHQQPNRLAAITESQNKQARAPVLTSVRVADHRAGAVIAADPKNLVPAGQFEVWMPAGTLPNFAGTWVQTVPRSGPAMHMEIMQNGSQLTVYISYTEGSSQPFGQASMQGDNAVWALPQGCSPEYQKPGYDYTQPGMNTFTLELNGSVLIYTQQTKWTSPCDGHSIGTETINKNLQRSE